MDARRFSASAARNRDPILAALRPRLKPGHLVLEIASGSGEHAMHFAESLPEVTFQPSDRDPDARASIEAWVAASGLPNLRPPVALDAASADWPVTEADVVLSLNMIHISPWASAEGLVSGATRILPPGGLLVLYGPFLHRDRPTSPSNIAFDADLRARDPLWGIRGVDAIAALATGFDAPEILDMPANNFMLFFRRAA